MRTLNDFTIQSVIWPKDFTPISILDPGKRRMDDASAKTASNIWPVAVYRCKASSIWQTTSWDAATLPLVILVVLRQPPYAQENGHAYIFKTEL